MFTPDSYPNTTRVLVTGAGGFIGHHLVKRLKQEKYWVRGVDIKYPEYEDTLADEFLLLDLREYENCITATKEIEQAYNLAADMGGIGYITQYLADIARNNTLINVNMLHASAMNRVNRFLFSSSACVYAQSKQSNADVVPLKEQDAYPADPEPGYGWEKLFAEQMCHYYLKNYGLVTKIVRFHNVYGPLGTYDGGKEKAPAAICRKISLLDDGDELEVWGDGKQTRSFMYIDDCTEGLIRLMTSEHYKSPLNLGTDELVTIDGLVDIVSGIAKKKVIKRHDVTQPQGVRGRNSDNSLLRSVLKWEPAIKLADGLKPTYDWVQKETSDKNSIARFALSGGANRTFLHPLSEDSVVFDVGGYEGDWSEKISHLYNPTILMFEPVREFYNKASEKLKDNSKIQVFNFGLSSKNALVDIVKREDSSSVYHRGGPTEKIEIRDIVDIAAKFSAVDLISINIEGGEYDLLQRILDSGAVSKFKNIQVQFHRFYPDSEKLRETLRSRLSLTHREIYGYPFVWEAWTMR